MSEKTDDSQPTDERSGVELVFRGIAEGALDDVVIPVEYISVEEARAKWPETLSHDRLSNQQWSTHE